MKEAKTRRETCGDVPTEDRQSKGSSQMKLGSAAEGTGKHWQSHGCFFSES